ncbi:MAG: SagB/ThcOx family dehydrogenase [Candidatus Erginobacter occultus]|nr:SagB/ThcOx family dehydrogenase [Candidatus Erginobacter occultus]
MGADGRYGEGRFWLKDTIRQLVDFSRTGQSREVAPPPFQKPVPASAERVGLPGGSEALRRLAKLPVGEAIIARESRRDFGADPFSIEELSALLWAVQGVKRVLSPAAALRSVPSAGARHSFETYLAANRVEGLAPGIYRYLPFDGELVRLAGGKDTAQRAARACLGQGFVAEAAAVFFWTAIPARMEWRYGAAAYKVIALDAGHVGQNLYLAAEALGAGVCAIAAYDQEACDRLLGVDGEEEFTVYIAAAGRQF